MEKPDANGYVNVKWPSKSIPHGGIFHTKIVQPSAEREKILKVLLEESKLNLALRRKDGWKLRENIPISTKNNRKLIPTIRPRTSRRRSLSEIRNSGILEIDRYHPLTKGEDREQMKQKLQEDMAWGDDKPKQASPKIINAIIKPALPTRKQFRNEILTQIRERVDWLADMEALGEGAAHRQLIQDQIAQRIRNLEELGEPSECSSIADSGFSTIRSSISDTSRKTANSTDNIKSAVPRIPKIKTKHKSGRTKQMHEENISAFEKLSLRLSPRRRC